MRILVCILLITFAIGVPFPVAAGEPDITARLLVSNPSPYLGEEIDLLLEVTYNGHPGGRTRFNWPQLDNFISADLTALRSQSSRDGQNRLIETIRRRIKPLKYGTMILSEAAVLTDNQTIRLEPITLRVQPLPLAGRPEIFNNRVGTYSLILAADGAGPREIHLHISDSNQLTQVPKIDAWPGSGEQLIPFEVKTRTDKEGGREHILKYYYHPVDGDFDTLRFTLPVFDPRQQTYRIIETGPAPKTTSTRQILSSLIICLLFAAGLASFTLKRHPRTINGCLQRLCQRPVAGLSRDRIQSLVHPHLDSSEIDALHRYWQYEDSINFDLNRSTEQTDTLLITKRLRQSLWKAIDKHQDNP